MKAFLKEYIKLCKKHGFYVGSLFDETACIVILDSNDESFDFHLNEIRENMK